MWKLDGVTKCDLSRDTVILNSDLLNLDYWKIEIKFRLGDTGNGCFIFDKRNGQWHRNYCFGFMTPEWFNHHDSSRAPGYYFFVDVGDGTRVEHEFTNGIGVPVSDIRLSSTYTAKMSYNGKCLYLGVSVGDGDITFGSRSLDHLGSVKGGGNLVVGSMGEPYLDAFPQYGLGKFVGVVYSLKILPYIVS